MRTAVALSILLVSSAFAQPSYKDLKYPPLRQVKIPDVPVYNLPNGIKLYLLENHELPLVSGFALIRTGGLFDPSDKNGLAQMTGHVMRTGGTKAKTGDQIDTQVENLAASVESIIGLTSGRVSFGPITVPSIVSRLVSSRSETGSRSTMPIDVTPGSVLRRVVRSLTKR